MTKTLDHAPTPGNEQVIMKIDEPDRVPQFDASEHVNTNIGYDRVGLGTGAVKAALARTELAISGDEYGFDVVEAARLKSGIATAREELENLTPAQKARFNNYLSTSPASDWLDVQLGFGENEIKKGLRKDYAGRLSERNKDSDEYAVSDQSLLHFLEWHNHNLAVNQKWVERHDKEFKATFKDKLTKAIAKGWVPQWVNDRIDTRLERTEIAIDDGFASTFKNTLANALRLDINGDDSEVVISPESPESDGVLEKLLTHEFVHVMDGKAGAGANARGLYKLFGNQRDYAGMALNEAVVEHLADVMYKGKDDINIIDPKTKSRKDAYYPKERELLNVLANMGKNKIDIRLFIAAHFDEGEHKDEQGRTPVEVLKDEIKNAFPDIDVLSELDEMSSLDEIHKYTKQLRRRIGHRHPTLAEVGHNTRTVVRRTAKVTAALAAVAAVSLAGGKLLFEAERHFRTPSEQYTYNYDNDTSPGSEDWGVTNEGRIYEPSPYFTEGQDDVTYSPYRDALPPIGTGGILSPGPDVHKFSDEQGYVVTIPPIDSHYTPENQQAPRANGKDYNTYHSIPEAQVPISPVGPNQSSTSK